MPVQIGAQTISGGSSTGTAEALARWSAEKRQAQAQANLRQAREEGQQVEIAQEDGKRVMPEEAKPKFGFFGKKTAEEYNLGVRDAYILSVDSDNTSEISRIAQEADGNLDNFEEVAGQYRSTVLANVDPVAADSVRQSLDSMISRGRDGVQRLGIDRQIKQDKQAREIASQNYYEEAGRLIRKGDAQGAEENLLKSFAAIDSMVQSGDLSKEAGEEQKIFVQNRVTEEGYRAELVDTFDESGPQSAYDQLEELSKEVPQYFSPEEWDTFINKAQSDLNKKLARMKKEAVLSAKEKSLAADYSAIEKRLDGDDSIIINPRAVDSFYQERLAPALQEMPVDVRQAAQANFINSLKYVPKGISSQVVNAVNSDNPDLISEAATMIDRIDQLPGVVNNIPKQQQAYISRVNLLMQNMEPKEAIDIARKATDPRDKARIEAVDTQLKGIKKDSPEIYMDRSQEAFHKMFRFSEPQVDDISKHKMAKEYEGLVSEFMRAGMDEESAFDKADKYIKRTWGEDDTLGENVIMKYPVSDYYSIEGDTSWVKPQLMTDIQDAIFGVKAEKVFLASNEQTARLASIGKPSYQVIAVIDGVLTPLEKNWAPDYDAELARRQNEKLSKKIQLRKDILSGEVKLDKELRNAMEFN